MALASGAGGAQHGSAPQARQILETSGVRGGLVVHLGCAGGTLTAALHAGDAYLVHGLDSRAADVEKARSHIRSLGLYGPVSAATFDGEHLPYVDNLVNLVVSEDPDKVPMNEILRVLAPGGVAMVGGNKTVKPWPAAIDDWTHFFHGPDNNALADDRVVGPPRHMQWLAGPKWTRHHHSDKGTNPAIRAVVSARGRLYYMVDEAGTSDMTVPGRWFLAARDGFSGVGLWKKPLEVTTFERRLERVWRTLVADGDRVYAPLGAGRPLSAFDGATGAVVRTYPGTEGFQEMVKVRSALYLVGKQGTLLALEADSGRPLWQWNPPPGEGDIVPLTLAASGGKVFVKTDESVLCLSAEAGKTLWRVPLEGSQKRIRLRWPRERLLVSDGVVLCSYGGKDPKVLDRDTFAYLGSHPRVNAYGGKLAALAAEDGRRLWNTVYRPGLESTPGEIYISDAVVWLGPDFARPRDLRTGAVIRTRPVLERLWTTGHHYRCYPGKATCRYIITAKRGIEMFDLTGENHSRNNWARATCRVGVTPCNGLLYAPPHSCGCYMEARLYGFWALAPKRPGEERTTSERRNRLERGPAYGQIRQPPSATPKPDDWPTYRGDTARSGSTTAPVPTGLNPLWKTDVGGRLSPITVADSKVFVAEVDAHTVHALDAESGRPVWRFTASGRVDSPPTLHEGLVLFGSQDGCVYCLRADDGRLVWRFHAAPKATAAVAFEQVESLWPVHGSVLVRDGIAYAAAGRSSYLDGGIVLYGLDPKTGDVRCTTRVASEHTGALDPPPENERAGMSATIGQNRTDYKTFLAADRSDAFSMRGALTDVLVAGGESVFMRQMRFDGNLVQQKTKRAHLFSTSSLLDGEEHHRSHWVLGTGDFSRTTVAYPWIVTKRLAVPYGLMLAFDQETVWGVRRIGKREHTDHYVVFASPRPDPSDEASRLPDFAERRGTKSAAGSWTTVLSLRPRAMIRAGHRLFIGGEPAAPASNGKAAARSAGAKPNPAGVLRMVSCADGATVGERRLESPPVWDGMAAAAGRIYLATRSGRILCMTTGK